MAFAPRSVRLENITTGSLPNRRRISRSVVIPSITGISTSSSTRSGRAAGMAARQASPLMAVPTIFSSGSAPSVAVRIPRIVAESSQIKTPIGARLSACDGSATTPRSTSLRANAAAVNGFARYSSIPACRASAICSCWCSVEIIRIGSFR